jgi:host factor-I protein
VEPANRRLIRPSFSAPKEQNGPRRNQKPKSPPSDQTHAETFYYLKQMQTRTPMVVVLSDGEIVQGVIEWYDKNCLKLNRTDRPNILLLKHNIKYLYKESEETHPSANGD